VGRKDKNFDATQMLFQAEDTGTTGKPSAFKPTRWNYSSGTTNLLSGICKAIQNTSRIFRFLVYRFR
jgi:hypothetical protein